MTEDLQDRNARLRGKIEQLVDNHPELEAVVNDVALKQPTTASLEKVHKPICNSGREPQSRLSLNLRTDF